MVAGEHDVGVRHRVGGHELEHDGEEVVASEPTRDGVGIRADHRRIAVVDDERVDAVAGQRVAEPRHRDLPARGLGPQVRTGHGVALRRERVGAVHVRTATRVLPRAGDGREREHRAEGLARVRLVVRARSELHETGASGGPQPRHRRDLIRGDAGGAGRAVQRPLGGTGPEVVGAVGAGREELRILETLGEDDVHHPERERGVASGSELEVDVARGCGLRAERIDADQRPAVLLHRLEVRPEVQVGGERVHTPRDRDLRLADQLRVRRGEARVRERVRPATGGKTDVAVELGAPEPVEEPSVHRRALQHPLRPHVAERQHRLGAGLAR